MGYKGRKEGTLEQWKELYQVASEIKEMKPWEIFSDVDLIGLKNEDEDDIAFVSIMGNAGNCYGISVYEGLEGLNDFLKLLNQEELGMSPEYAMFTQTALTCYWGDRAELSEEQRRIIRELGYKYRGKNQWLYFMSFEPGYYPYNLSQEEVNRMTMYLTHLRTALQKFRELHNQVNLEYGSMLLFEFDEDGEVLYFGEELLPFIDFQFRMLELTDGELIDKLSKEPRCEMVLEADIISMGVSVRDKQFRRPANPTLCLIMEAKSNMMVKCEMPEPEEDPLICMAEQLEEFILANGIPKEIRFSNVMVLAGLAHICKICDIRLTRVENLEGIGVFKEGMEKFI